MPLELDIMSFNIRNMRSNDGPNGWEQRRDSLYDLIRRHEPDVLGVQEAYLPQVEQLRAALPDYEAIGVGRDDGATEGEHCTIHFLRDRFTLDGWGTFWFSETPDVPGSRHWTRVHPRICTWARLIDTAGQTFYVYNVHLDHESELARERSVLLLLHHIRNQEPSHPTLLMGDFNMGEDDPAIARLLGADAPQLVDTFRAIHPEVEEAGTFHNFTGGVDGDRIDFIFCTPEFRPRDGRILRDHRDGRYPSDHFPIMARVSL